MNNKEIIKILKEMKLDNEKVLADNLRNEYSHYRAERYLKSINEILKMLGE